MNICKYRLLPLLAVASALLLLQACGDDRNPYEPDYSEAPPPFDTTEYVSKEVKEDGLLTVYIIEEGGSSDSVNYRDRISVRYTGRTQDGEIFESTYRDGFDSPQTLQNLTPESKQVGNNNISPLIEGFRKGLLGMVEGEKRTIVVPPSLGYGDTPEGQSGYSLRNDTLIFDVELVGILD